MQHGDMVEECSHREPVEREGHPEHYNEEVGHRNIVEHSSCQSRNRFVHLGYHTIRF